MTEHDLVAQLLGVLRPAALRLNGVVFKPNDRATSGIPDISFTAGGRSSWWEVKHAKPFVKGTGLQHLTCRRLAAAGICWYIIYQTCGGKLSTHLVRPSELTGSGAFVSVAQVSGFDHLFVLQFMMKEHGL